VGHHSHPAKPGKQPEANIASSSSNWGREAYGAEAEAVSWSPERSIIVEAFLFSIWGGGSTEPAAVSRPTKGRRPWWARLDRDLRAGQMLVWITREHGRSPSSLLKHRNRARRSNKCPGAAMVSGCRAEKTDKTGDAPGERRAKQALWKRGSLSTLIVPVESWETQPLGSQ